MAKIVLMLVLVFLAIGSACSQMVSPLHQVMSANSLINRPEVFRDMQEYIASAYKDLPPGVKLDYFYKKMVPIRDNLLSYIEAPVIFKPEFTRIDTVTEQFSANSIAVLRANVKDSSRTNVSRDTFFVWRGLSVKEIAALRSQITSKEDSQLLESLIKKCRKARFEYRAKKVIDIDFGKLKTPSMILNDIQNQLARELDTILRNHIPSSLGNDVRAAVLAGILAALKQAGVIQSVSLGSESSDYIQTFSNTIAEAVMDKLREAIRQRFPEVLVYDESYIDTLIERIPLLDDELKTIARNLKEDIKSNLDKAENTLATAVNEYAKQFLSGNTGFAVTEGEGAFTGGVMYAFVSGHFQSGMYINGQFNKSSNNSKSDTTLVAQQFLLGFQVRFATDDKQFDFLFSKLIGENKSSELEVGMGVSYRITDGLIIGAAGFSLLREQNDVYTIGATFKGTGSESPAVLVGTNFQDGREATPIFQISLPILPKR